MPLGPGVRYRVKKTGKGPVRLAFRGNKVVEATKMRGKSKKGGGMKDVLASHIQHSRFSKSKR